ncbi:serine/threonine protein kinase [Nonomuraea cypriaca]|nr:serine/threonine-protein kinase [Nonomuraea cypriaca]
MANPLTPDDPASLGGFRLAGRLGEGGQGVVYLAHDDDGEPVAIKLLSTGDKETRARLARELNALEGIASFCTARVIDVSTGGPRPFVVSEFVDGPSLADRVRERGPLRGGELERLVVGTATALAAIHAAGVVHRDFKPSNVLLGPDGPRVVDFGIARAEGAATVTSGLIGTPAYLAPEQINGSPAAPASDVFAWAASMVYAATGMSPFGADTVAAVLNRVLHAEPDLSPLPPRLREVIASCLAKDPAWRPTAQQLMVSLVTPNARPGLPADAGHHPLPTGPQGPGPQGLRPPGSRPQGSGPQGPAAGAGARGFPAPMAHGPAGPHDGGNARPHGPAGSRDGGNTGPQGPAMTTDTARAARSRGVVIGAVTAVVVLSAAGAAALLMNRGPTTNVERSPSALESSAPESSATAPSTTVPSTTAPSTTAPSTTAPSTTAPPTESTEPTEAAESPTESEPEASADLPVDPTVNPDLKIPAAFEGDWSGHTTSTNPMDPDGADNEVELKEGESTARWSEEDASYECQATITLTKVEAEQLTFYLGRNDDNCVPGTIRLAMKGDTLTYTWRDEPGPGLITQTGTLNKN